jgi:carboxyl-terminal processing protease
MTRPLIRRAAAVQLAVLFALFSCFTLFAADGPAPGLTLNERVYAASRIYASLSYFAHWQNVPDLDAEAAYRAYLDKAIAASDRAAFSRASMEFLADFHNAHTVFIDMPLVRQGGSLPFLAQEIHGQWVVTESFSAGIKPGDAIESIDGRPFGEFVVENIKMISASTDAGARRVLFAREPTLAFYAHLFPERFELTLGGGRKVQVDRGAAKNASLAETGGRWLEPGKVAYIRIPSFFTPENEKKAIELVHTFTAADVLIVDVRGNAGGQTPTDLIAQLMDRPYPWWAESTPVAMPYFRIKADQGNWQLRPFQRPQFSWPSTTQRPNKEHFEGRIAILADAGCYSSCEDFTMPFKVTRRAVIVGENHRRQFGTTLYARPGPGNDDPGRRQTGVVPGRIAI